MLVQHPKDVLVEAHGGHEELLPVEKLHGEGVAAVGIVRRQDGQQLVVPQGRPFQRAVLLSAGEAHIHPVLQHPAVHLVHAAHLDVHGHVRVLPAELLDHLRQPVAGDGLIGRHPDAVLLVGVDEGDLPLQGGAAGEAVLHQRENALPRRGQLYAGAASHQNGEADVLFQAVHHVGQAGLGVAQLLRGPGEAAQLHRGHQRLQFLRVHRHPPA